MNSREALEVIMACLKKEPVVVATGYLCRLAQAAKDRNENFYMIGSMGMASSIALGLSLAKPRTRSVIIDGDGAVLMNLGHLPMAGALKPKNLVHIVIDNTRYESTGGQPTYSSVIKLERIARASGYRLCTRVSKVALLKKSVKRALKSTGPSFILVRVTDKGLTPPERIRRSPEAITRLFRESLAS